jgi:hypothetical protein
MAVRSAFALGLHREEALVIFTPEDQIYGVIFGAVSMSSTDSSPPVLDGQQPSRKMTALAIPSILPILCLSLGQQASIKPIR